MFREVKGKWKMPTCPFCKMHLLTGDDLQSHMMKKHPQDASDTSHYINVQRKPAESKPIDPYIIIDGNNVAYFDSKNPKAKNLKLAHFHSKKQGYDPIIFVSSDLREKIDSELDLTRMINLNWVVEAKGNEGIPIIEEALNKKCEIVSNAEYSDYLEQYNTEEWSLKKSIKKFTIENGKFMIQKN